MTMQRALFELLYEAAAPDVGTPLADARIYALKAPDHVTAPFIVFQRIDKPQIRVINGPSGLAQAVMQIDFYARTYYGANDLARKVDSAIDGFRGVVPYGNNSPQDEIKFGGISQQNDIETLDETDEPLLYRVTMTYLITYHQ